MVKTRLFALALIAGLFGFEGCDYETLRGPVDCEKNPVTLQLVSAVDADCALMDGSIRVAASGGLPPYTFAMEGRPAQPDSLFQGLAAGVYQISAVDLNNCSATLEVTIRNKNGVNITFQTTDAGCNGSDGELTVTASDGTGPYQFRLGDGGFSANNKFTGLSPGDYMLSVQDATGCAVTQKVKVRSGVRYSTSISRIIESNCAVSGCHSGSQFPDFRVFKNIHDNAAQIKKLTADRTMPQDGTLTQDQINLIGCWVDDGAPDN